MVKSSIAIIGAGILGSAIAAELATENYSVNVFTDSEKASTATPKSFGWINAHSPEKSHHFQMRLESMRLWNELKAIHPALPIKRITAIDWDMPQDEIASVHRLYSEQNHSTELLKNSELKTAFPDVQWKAECAIVSTNDMVAIPEQIAEFFHVLASARGATFHSNQTIDMLSSNDDGITLEWGEENQTFDHVVIAAGTGSAALLKLFGYELPMTNRTGALFRSEPQSTRLNYLISAPDFHCWQLPDGSLIAGTAQAGSDLSKSMEEVRQQLSNTLQELVPDFKNISFTSHTLGKRPEPKDAMPVIDVLGNKQNLHIAVMHSGITLAPFVAKAVAQHIKTGRQHEKVKPYHLDRFQPEQEKIAV